MLSDIWESGSTVVFVQSAVTELSERLGFYHLHPKDRFWELLVVGGITPKYIITTSERKALSDGQRNGSLSDPVRGMFTQKKTDQLVRLGIGLTALNRRVIAVDEKDRSAKPTPDDIAAFVEKVGKLTPKVLAFVTTIEMFVDLFKDRSPGLTDSFGPKSFKIVGAEVWLLGATTAVLRGAGLTSQEDAFFALGERIQALKDTRQ